MLEKFSKPYLSCPSFCAALFHHGLGRTRNLSEVGETQLTEEFRIRAVIASVESSTDKSEKAYSGIIVMSANFP